MQSIARATSLSIALMSAALLPACSAGTLSDPPPQSAVIMMCPPLREYEPETIKRSGDELAGLSKADQNAATPSLVADYKLLRDQCRAIEDVKP